MRVALVALCLAAGCKKPTAQVVDLDLPEERPSEDARSPREILVDAAGSLDPSLRGHALGYLISSSTEAAGGEFGPRALYDPDGWVQRQGIRALADRVQEKETLALLTAYLERSEADPYSRGFAAMRVADNSNSQTREALTAAWKEQTQRWRAAPLALGALAHGDEEALPIVSGALSRGDVALEPDFLGDVGTSGRAELLEALQDGEKWVEPELALAYAAARVQLGDPSGEQILRRALSSDEVGVRLEALEYLDGMNGTVATNLLKKARGQGSELMRAWAELALVARGEADAAVIMAAAESEDPEIRGLAARFAGETLSGALAKPKVVKQLEDVLRSGLEDPDTRVRASALSGSAGVIWTDREGDLIARLTDDSKANQVHAAGLLLGR